jgi:hypothetical protein
MSSYTSSIYYIKPWPSIRCKTKTSIVHKRLEQFFDRHRTYDYSDDRYTYIVTRICHPTSENEYVEITYTQFSCIYDSPTKEIAIYKPTKKITITDNFSENNQRRYQCFVQL